MPYKDPGKRADYLKEYRANNKEKIVEYRKEYWANNKGKIAGHRKEYRANNEEKIVEYGKEYRLANKESIAAKKRARYAANPGIWIRNNLKRKNKLKMALPENPEDRAIIQEIYKLRGRINKCMGILKLMHVDHIIPVSKGGLHTPGNLQILPAKLNLSKHNKLVNISTNFQNENTNTNNPS